MDYLLEPSLLVESFSLSLLHSLWQGCLVGCLAAIGFALLRRSPNLRYLLGVGCLALFAACPLTTFYWLYGPNVGESISAAEPITMTATPVLSSSVLTEFTVEALAPSNEVWSLGKVHLAIFGIWVFGQLVVGCRLVSSACFVYRLKRLAAPITPELRRVAEQIAERIGVRCPKIASSRQVAGAMAAGLLKPIIVLPAAWLAEMTPAMLEAVIAHELAHVKRYDLWVNFFQRVVESLLFFHPLVWWLSRKIRVDRELCCDTLAVQATNQRRQYAETLEHVARLRSDRNLILVTQIGDDRMSLLRRVRFILGQESNGAAHGWWPAGLLAMAIPCGLMFLGQVVPSLAEEAGQASPVTPPMVEDGLIVPANGAESNWEGRLSLEAFGKTMRTAALPHAAKKVKQVWPLGGPYLIEPPDVIAIEFKEPLTPLVDKKTRPVADKENLGGKYLVGPDGKVQFASYAQRFGQVYVSGMTLDEAAKAIQTHLSKHFENPKVTVDLAVNNSKVFYIIIEGAEADQVIRMPVTGGETVLDAISDAISGMGGLEDASNRKMYISRPSENVGCDQILPIDWDRITRGGYTTSWNRPTTNYQLLPGDRLFVEPIKDEDDLTRLTASRHVRIPIMGALTSGGQAKGIDPPTDKEILALVRAGAADSELLAPENRERLVITKELIADYVDPPKNYPLIGPAQMHHAHYKCTVALRCDKTAKAIQPPRCFFVDHQHLHADKELVVRPQATLVDPRPVVDDSEPRRSYTRTYDVADLVLPIAAPEFSVDGKPRQKSGAKADFDTLIELIQTAVAPGSWEKVGGDGSIAAFEANLSLVVSQSQIVHERIADVLQDLRSLQESKIALRAMNIELPNGLLGELGLKDKPFAVLTAKEKGRIVAAANGDPHARTFSESKAMLFNGEQMKMKVADDLVLATQVTIGDENSLGGFACLARAVDGKGKDSKKRIFEGVHVTANFTGDQTILVQMESDPANPNKSVFRLISAEAVVPKTKASK